MTEWETYPWSNVFDTLNHDYYVIPNDTQGASGIFRPAETDIGTHHVAHGSKTNPIFLSAYEEAYRLILLSSTSCTTR